MGTSYDGVFGYGMIIDPEWSGDDDAPERWPYDDDFDFSTWIDEVCGVPDYSTFAEYSAYDAAREAAMIARFGFILDTTYIGYSEYPLWVVHVKGAIQNEWRGGVAIIPDSLTIEAWKAALLKVRELMPEADEPALIFGCSVG